MPSQSVRDRYASDGAGVIPQTRLLVMLFDRLVLDVQQAETAVEQRQLEVANDKLTHAQAILLELHAALDLDAWDGAAQLSRIYLWLIEELVRVNVSKEAGALKPCIRMLADLQEAWQGAYDQIGAMPLASFAANIPAPSTNVNSAS